MHRAATALVYWMRAGVVLSAASFAGCDNDGPAPVSVRLLVCGLITPGELHDRAASSALSACTQDCRARARCDELRTLVCERRSSGELEDCEAACRNPRPCVDGRGQFELRRACDGRSDCSDGSDEWGCEAWPVCKSSGRRLAEGQVCDGVADCSDGSDEAGCDPSLRRFSCKVSSPAGPASIPWARVCDLTPDCADGSDEGKAQGCAELVCR
ncbi:MAG: hypothetical protein RL385_1005 [Pseudomonadota bacterium]